MADNEKVVTGPLVIARYANGADGYFYQGAVLPKEGPDGLREGEVARLEETGLVRSKAEADKFFAEQGPSSVALPDAAPLSGAQHVPGEDERSSGSQPKASASKAEWVDYAVAQGMPRDDADAATKEELREKYAQ